MDNVLIYGGLSMMLAGCVVALIAAIIGFSKAGRHGFLPMRFINSDRELYQAIQRKIRPWLRVAVIIGLSGAALLTVGIILGLN